MLGRSIFPILFIFLAEQALARAGTLVTLARQ